MAAKKKIEEVKEDELTTEELVEANETPEAVAEEVEETVAALSVDDSSEVDEETKVVKKAGKRSAKAIREAEAEEARLEAKEERAEAEASDEPRVVTRSVPNPLHMHGKKYREAAKLVDATTYYSLDEAIELVAKTSTTKFDSSVELHVNLGVDPRQADQMVRATVVLPHGTGKSLKVAVFADGKAAEEAKAAGADIVATVDLMADIEAGKLNFDLLISTPDKMAALGKVARILGPRGLMPNPKSGTVTANPGKAVEEAKAGKVEYRIDKQAIVHQAIGKVSFKPAALRDNATTFLSSILKAKPSASKGTYVKAISITSSMGPGIKLDSAATIAAISGKK